MIAKPTPDPLVLENDISTASQSAMDAYSNVIALGLDPSVMYKSLSPAPVNDLEDEGSMA